MNGILFPLGSLLLFSLPILPFQKMAPNAYDKATSGYTSGPTPSGSPSAAAMHEQVRQGAKEQVCRQIND